MFIAKTNHQTKKGKPTDKIGGPSRNIRAASKELSSGRAQIIWTLLVATTLALVLLWQIEKVPRWRQSLLEDTSELEPANYGIAALQLPNSKR